MRNPLLAPALAFALACSFAAAPARAEDPAPPPAAATAPAVDPAAPPAAKAAPLYPVPAPSPQEMPPPDSPARPKSSGRRRAFLASGIVVASIGAMYLAGGVALVATAGPGSGDDDDPFPGIQKGAGAFMLGVGILHALVGGALVAAGLAEPKRSVPGVYTLSSRLLPTAAPRGPGGLAWTF